MKRKKLIHADNWIVDRTKSEPFSNEINVIVVDNYLSKEHNNKLKVKEIRTSNEQLWAGRNTIALFKITKRHAGNIAL